MWPTAGPHLPFTVADVSLLASNDRIRDYGNEQMLNYPFKKFPLQIVLQYNIEMNVRRETITTYKDIHCMPRDIFQLPGEN